MFLFLVIKDFLKNLSPRNSKFCPWTKIKMSQDKKTLIIENQSKTKTKKMDKILRTPENQMKTISEDDETDTEVDEDTPPVNYRKRADAFSAEENEQIFSQTKRCLFGKKTGDGGKCCPFRPKEVLLEFVSNIIMIYVLLYGLPFVLAVPVFVFFRCKINLENVRDDNRMQVDLEPRTTKDYTVAESIVMHNQ